ncbi:hypothetical protein Ahy_A03g012836 [Arachis hypogaea]|uniref:DNA helicase Pif1-like 2B domain-containing protein n=1 Tax=Arachis hypogaea TaxID=3818 RepID=A0A445DUA7_ARAHY|nr:hypothetical protein Ahy_A03g012836 [Arachis hypogaea]
MTDDGERLSATDDRERLSTTDDGEQATDDSEQGMESEQVTDESEQEMVRAKKRTTIAPRRKFLSATEAAAAVSHSDTRRQDWWRLGFAFLGGGQGILLMTKKGDRSILAPIFDVVTEVNNHVISLLPGNEKVYLRSDTLLNEDDHLESELYTMSTESLNELIYSGIPQHKLVLKIGVPVMLLHNIVQSNRLCNGTRMQVRRLGNHVIECVILAGRNVGQIVLFQG